MFYAIIFPVLYGLAMFMLGMKVMEVTLARWAGPMLISLLSKATSSPIKGMLFSTFITAILQSSTAVTVITIGLVNAGLLTYARTLGIILGSNIGTCLTTELMGLQLGKLAPLLLLVSIVVWAVAVVVNDYTPSILRRFKHFFEPTQYISLIIAGFALIMFGIRIMQSIGSTLDSYGVFSWFIERASQNVLWGVIAGACLTAIIHSSSAVIGLAMGLASSGALPVEIGIAIVLGSNVGTCVTAVIAATGSTSSGKFVAWTHVILNVGGAALFMPFIQQLHHVSAWLTSDLGSQIARSQTIFNILCSLIVLPICYLPIWTRIDRSPS